VATQVVTDRVQRLFVEALNIQVPSPDHDLIDGGLLDSLALVELLFAIEREFEVSIPLEDLDIDTFRSARSIAEFVEKQGGPSA
jgi:methoxymalonate biosynthesis acyl carrier protein